MAGFSKSAPQHPRADYLAGTVKLNRKVILRLLNNILFCQPFCDYTEDAAPNASDLTFTLVQRCPAVESCQKIQQYAPAPLETYFFSNACPRSGFTFMIAVRSRSI